MVAEVFHELAFLAKGERGTGFWVVATATWFHIMGAAGEAASVVAADTGEGGDGQAGRPFCAAPEPQLHRYCQPTSAGEALRLDHQFIRARQVRGRLHVEPEQPRQALGRTAGPRHRGVLAADGRRPRLKHRLPDTTIS